MAEYTVAFESTGESIQVAETETILRACLREGIAQEYSCRVGMCLACCAEIALTEAERERYALTCMARPQSDLRLARGVYPPSVEADAGEPAPADD